MNLNQIYTDIFNHQKKQTQIIFAVLIEGYSLNLQVCLEVYSEYLNKLYYPTAEKLPRIYYYDFAKFFLEDCLSGDQFIKFIPNAVIGEFRIHLTDKGQKLKDQVLQNCTNESVLVDQIISNRNLKKSYVQIKY